jgi:hypothetical protein
MGGSALVISMSSLNGSLLMVVDDFHVLCSLVPAKADAELVVDPDGMLPNPVAGKGLCMLQKDLHMLGLCAVGRIGVHDELSIREMLAIELEKCELVGVWSRRT